MKFLTEEIKALPLPDGFRWEEDHQVFGALKDGWWHWFCYPNKTMHYQPLRVDYHGNNDGARQTHHCMADSKLHAAQIISAKVCFGLYE